MHHHVVASPYHCIAGAGITAHPKRPAPLPYVPVIALSAPQGFLLRRILLFGKLVNCIHHIVIVVSAYLTTDSFHAPMIVSFQQLYYKQDKSSDQARIVYSVLFFGAWPVFPENYIKCPVQVVFYIFQCLRATIENSSALGLMLHRKYRS